MKIFHLSEPNHGWIDITFGQPPDGHTVTASCTPNDCLRDLVAATVRLLASSIDEVVKFSLEPGFALCRMQRDSDSVRVTVSLLDLENSVFDATFPLGAFAKRLRFELLRIESRYSDQDGWKQPFPKHEIDKLA